MTPAVAVGIISEARNLRCVRQQSPLPCPVCGTIIAVNDRLEMEAETINQDPYGAGWLAVIEAKDWFTDKGNLMRPAAYFEHMKAQAQKEV